ncbi:hypothetical protein [Pannonibacter tanglangensis]|uniref:Uncharacterized protein n=1 Tax=Pannonibacter tanglangensis TaxID=2750084 RepID=A0ABW9ZDN0_9HYPH|nr:hypothetical protein [Pannonibacter sp. XCT-34]NBN62778.1 hypothetical protein [Pannonibacter sp. XCT-34]
MTATITIHPDMSATVETPERICRLPAYHPERLTPWASEDELMAYAQAIQHDNRFMVPKGG